MAAKPGVIGLCPPDDQPLLIPCIGLDAPDVSGSQGAHWEPGQMGRLRRFAPSHATKFNQ